MPYNGNLKNKWILITDSKVKLVHLSWNILMDEIKRAGKVYLRIHQ